MTADGSRRKTFSGAEGVLAAQTERRLTPASGPAAVWQTRRSKGKLVLR
jgi:hypothetical protein